MQARILPTNEWYQEIINTPELTAKETIYRERFLQPWQAMLQMMKGGADMDDIATAAQRWRWLVPENLSETPPALTKLEEAKAWEIAQLALEKAVAQFEPYADQIPYDEIEGWLIVANPDGADPIHRGYTGATDWTQPQFVVQYDTPNDYNLPRLTGTIAHEMHHLIRLKLFPWDILNTSVADYIILEGLAESFAAELFGAEVVGYYVTDFDETQLDTARQLIDDGLDQTGFNIIRAYIFGDKLADEWGFTKIGMPAYGGYTIGYRIVQAYLAKTGQSVAEATFLPADIIIRESGYLAEGF